MEEQTISRAVHDADMARMERANKRLWIVVLVLLILLTATNAAWLWYESQFEEVTVTQEVETGEGSALVSGTGDVYGEG